MLRFTPKAIATGTAGVGSLGGSGYIYWNSLPATWHELLQKEGFRIIDQDDYYKGIYFDHKDGLMVDIPELNSNSIPSVNDATPKIKSWCKKELVTKPFWGAEGEKRRQLYINICTTSGIITVKGRMGHNNKTAWLEDEQDADTLWKAAFNIYRYDEEFLKWINQSESSKITKESKRDDHYTKLKNKCFQLLRLPYLDVQDVKTYNDIFWWCKALNKEETVESRIKRIDSNWKKEDKWDSTHKTWKDTTTVTNKIKSDSSLSSNPAKDDFKNWCEKYLPKKFIEEVKASEDFYQDKYLMVREVCNYF